MILFSSLLLISFLTFIKPSFSATVEPASVKHVYPSQINPQKDSSPYMPPLAKPRKPTTTSNHVSHIQASSAHPARSTVASHRGAGDPCGPVGNQTEFESTLNTCGQINSTYTHAPSIYGVQCLKANPTFNQTINTTSCASNIDDICEKISSSRATVSGWNWSSGVCQHFLLLYVTSPQLN